MTVPQRLRDKYAGAFEGELIRSARGDRPSRVARRRTLVAVGSASTIAALPATTTAAAGAKAIGFVGAVAAAKWASVGLAVGVLTIGGVQQAPRFFGDEAKPAAAIAPRAVEIPVPVVPNESPVRETVADEIRPVAPVPAPQRDQRVEPHRAALPPRATSAPVEAHTELWLADEIALLDEARRIVEKDPSQALRVLDRYAQRFPQGDLAPEALVLRIEGLVRTAQVDSAEALARAYLAKNPTSPHARRIRTLFGWAEDTR